MSCRDNRWWSTPSAIPTCARPPIFAVSAYSEIEQALADLTTGACDALMKLAPVTAWLVRDRPRLKVVQTGITRELLGICVRRGDDALKEAINEAQRALVEDGTLPRLVTKWLGPGASAAGSR